MEYRKLAKTDISISRVGIGCMSFDPEASQSSIIIRDAFDHGITLFDTADIYNDGRNELMLGKAVKAFRKKLVIATKVGNVRRKDGKGLDWDPSAKHIFESVDGSLKRLQTDYIDLYQLHGGTIDDNTEESVHAFETLKAQGKIRAYGISSIRPNVIRRWIEESAFSSLMIQYSALDRRPEEEILSLMQQQEKAVLVRGSVAQGLLTGKPVREYLDHERKTVEEVSKTMAGIADVTRTRAQIAMDFVMKNEAVTSVIVGVSNTQQLREAYELFEKPPLSNEDYELLERVSPKITYKDHR